MAKEKQIIRVEKSNNFSVINNEFLRRDDLSWKAKGIMAYLLTLPDDWKVYTDEIAKHSKDGRDGFLAGWRELKNNGYIERYPVKKAGKIVRWETVVRENPVTKGIPPFTDLPQVGNPVTGFPSNGNSHPTNYLSTNYLDIQNTNENNNTAEPANAEPVPDYAAEFNELWKLYPKGRKQGKDKAKATYIRERKKKNGPTFELVKCKLLDYIKQIKIKQTQPQFIKQGGTWFNQHGWADEYDFTAAAPTPARSNYNQSRRVEALPEWAKPGYEKPEEKPMDPEKKAEMDRKIAEFLEESARIDNENAKKNKK